MSRYGSVELKTNFLGAHKTLGLSSKSQTTYQSHYAQPMRPPKRVAFERSLSRSGLRLVENSSPSAREPKMISPFDKPAYRRHGWTSQEAPVVHGALEGSPEELVATGQISVQEYRARILAEMAPKDSSQGSFTYVN
ncbi:unnamed protein product [Cladocopium goreaui]|uniref:Uncharacterized protein n=1 Tax=Cladocopium goreaui TaxID=2562237 RepID=A0A9P1DQ91_9DINO|nr:unnamed protein product [Cladocopium goreaui]|mmetsp:Transcript_66917/g.146665  ORF Transcript_66917/g.146665 Transcript_66917/m.146665 type:complete len:137 (-) Transcript_66917:45-455(-)